MNNPSAAKPKTASVEIRNRYDLLSQEKFTCAELLKPHHRERLGLVNKVIELWLGPKVFKNIAGSGPSKWKSNSLGWVKKGGVSLTGQSDFNKQFGPGPNKLKEINLSEGLLSTGMSFKNGQNNSLGWVKKGGISLTGQAVFNKQFRPGPSKLKEKNLTKGLLSMAELGGYDSRDKTKDFKHAVCQDGSDLGPLLEGENFAPHFRSWECTGPTIKNQTKKYMFLRTKGYLLKPRTQTYS